MIAITSPQTPPMSGGSSCARSLSQRCSRIRLKNCQARMPPSTIVSQSSIWPVTSPTSTATAIAAASRTSANDHACHMAAAVLILLRRKPVARAVHRLHEAVEAGGLQGLSQPPDVHVDGALLHVDVPAPHAVQELAAGVHAIRVGHQEGQ